MSLVEVVCYRYVHDVPKTMAMFFLWKGITNLNKSYEEA